MKNYHDYTKFNKQTKFALHVGAATFPAISPRHNTGDVTNTENEERETERENVERGTGNGNRRTGNGERGTGERGPGTGDREPGMGVWDRVYSGNPLENSK